MKSCIQGSCISVPVPTELYVSLLDHLDKSTMDCDEPTAAVSIVIQKYLDSVRTSRPERRDAASALRRSNDSVTLGSPPAPMKSKVLKPMKQANTPHRNDWCIGCGCPAEDLIA